MFTWVSAPPFFYGLFIGLERRKINQPADPYAMLKIAGISTVFGSMQAYYHNTKHLPKLTPPIASASGALAGLFISGTVYYLGTLLGEKVPEKY